VDGRHWRPCEAELNALPTFVTEIDGPDTLVIHVRSRPASAADAALEAGDGATSCGDVVGQRPSSSGR
jgi:hypothetical protein